MRLFPVISLLALLLVPAGFAKDPTTQLNLVVRNEQGDPVSRASIIVRTLKGKNLKKVGETFQLKTSQQGTAPLPPVKQGVALIQIIADGYQTFGERIQLEEAEQTVTITLKEPADQLSVHK